MKRDKDTKGYMSQYDMNYMRNKIGASVGCHIFCGINLGATCAWYDRNGSYFDTTGASVDYPAYTLLDMRLSRQFGHFRLHADVNNLLNTRYCDFGGLEMPSRWFIMGVSVSI